MVNKMSGGMSRQQKEYFEEQMAEEETMAKEAVPDTNRMIIDGGE